MVAGDGDETEVAASWGTRAAGGRSAWRMGDDWRGSIGVRRWTHPSLRSTDPGTGLTDPAGLGHLPLAGLVRDEAVL